MPPRVKRKQQPSGLSRWFFSYSYYGRCVIIALVFEFFFAGIPAMQGGYRSEQISCDVATQNYPQKGTPEEKTEWRKTHTPCSFGEMWEYGGLKLAVHVVYYIIVLSLGLLFWAIPFSMVGLAIGWIGLALFADKKSRG